MAKNPLRITDTILRDAHQSQAATRMRIEDMLPACEKLDNMGRRNVRRLHAFPERRPVGASQNA